MSQRGGTAVFDVVSDWCHHGVMQIATHVEELQRQLAAAASAGSAEAQELAGRLAAALEPAVRLAILEALSEAAGEITRELAPGSVDVRLRGREVDFVVSRPVPEPEPATTPGASATGIEDAMAVATAALTGATTSTDDGDDGATSRTTVRLSDALKARAEAAAAVEGISLNTWFVRAVTAALEPTPAPAAMASRSSSYTGWLR